MFILFWMVGIGSSMIGIMLGWYYCRNLNWRIKMVKMRLHKTIRCEKRDRQVVYSLLKRIYIIINEGMTTNQLTAVYQTLDLLKLAFGYGLIRSGESTRLTAIGIGALNTQKPDIVAFVIDVFRPLARHLSSKDVVIVMNQLTLIGVISLKKKENFLAAKVVECILFIMEQRDGSGEDKIQTAGIKALRILGVISLRRRDTGLFREMTKRLLAYLGNDRKRSNLDEELAKMFAAWLHRILWNHETVLFTLLVEAVFRLVEGNVMDTEGVEILIDELGDMAATACLNPKEPLTRCILEFMFELANKRTSNAQTFKVIAIAGRVGKLSIYRHGLATSFVVLHPLLDFGRNLLAAELKYIGSNNESRRRQLFQASRENLSILAYAARQELLGTTGEMIIQMFTYWITHLEFRVQQKSIKKYCQLLLLLWLKNKRQPQKHMPQHIESLEPILFSDLEKERLGL